MDITVIIPGDVPTSVTLLTLTDPLGNAVTSAVNQPFVNTPAASETWIYTFAGPDGAYSYTYTQAYTGGNVFGPFSATSSDNDPGYQGEYITQQGLQLYLGSIDVAIASDSASTGNQNQAAIEQAIQIVESAADNILSGNDYGPARYSIPLDFGSNDVNPDFTLQLYKLAAFVLFQKRILEALTKKAPDYNKLRDDAMNWLRMAWDGSIVIVGAQTVAQDGTAPKSAMANVNPFGQPINQFGFPYGFGWGGGWW